MGTYLTCCGTNDEDKRATTESGLARKTYSNLTPNEIALLIKVQARFRGFLARKKIRITRYSVTGHLGIQFRPDGSVY